MNIPEHGIAAEKLLAELQVFGQEDLPWRDGRVFGYTFDGGREVERVAKLAFNEFMTGNALDPTVFPSLLRFENELIGMAATHLNGDEQVVGNFTSGGTESILLAVKSARDHAWEAHPDLKRPKILLSVTAHAAFHKAAHYMDMDIVPIPVSHRYCRTDMAAMREAVDDQVVMLVGSAPQYAHGVIDPIEEMAALAQKKDLWLHVDGCGGAFFLPYFARLGAELPVDDFRLDGVNSIPMDLHKYAYCPRALRWSCTATGRCVNISRSMLLP